MTPRDRPGAGETYGELLARNHLADAEATGTWRPPPLDTPARAADVRRAVRRGRRRPRARARARAPAGRRVRARARAQPAARPQPADGRDALGHGPGAARGQPRWTRASAAGRASNLAEYLVPVNADAPDVTVEFVEVAGRARRPARRQGRRRDRAGRRRRGDRQRGLPRHRSPRARAADGARARDGPGPRVRGADRAPSARASARAPGLLLWSCPIAALLAVGRGRRRSASLLVLGPLVTFALPLIAMVAFWWEDWPGTRLRAELVGLGRHRADRRRRGRADRASARRSPAGSTCAGIFDPRRGPARADLPGHAAAGRRRVRGDAPADAGRRGLAAAAPARVPAGLSALAASWAVALVVYCCSPRSTRRPGRRRRARGPSPGPTSARLLVLIGAWQVLFFVVWRGWPFTRDPGPRRAVAVRARRRARRRGSLTFVVARRRRGRRSARSPPRPACFVAAGLLVGMLFEGWLARTSPARGLAVAVVLAAACDAGAARPAPSRASTRTSGSRTPASTRSASRRSCTWRSAGAGRSTTASTGGALSVTMRGCAAAISSRAHDRRRGSDPRLDPPAPRAGDHARDGDGPDALVAIADLQRDRRSRDGHLRSPWPDARADRVRLDHRQRRAAAAAAHHRVLRRRPPRRRRDPPQRRLQRRQPERGRRRVPADLLRGRAGRVEREQGPRRRHRRHDRRGLRPPRAGGVAGGVPHPAAEDPRPRRAAPRRVGPGAGEHPARDRRRGHQGDDRRVHDRPASSRRRARALWRRTVRRAHGSRHRRPRSVRCGPS